MTPSPAASRLVPWVPHCFAGFTRHTPLGEGLLSKSTEHKARLAVFLILCAKARAQQNPFRHT